MGNCATKPKVKKDDDEVPAPVPAPETPVDKGKGILIECNDGVGILEKRPSLSHLFKEDEVKGIESEVPAAANPVFGRQITLSERPNLESEVPEKEKIVEINGNRNGIPEKFKPEGSNLGRREGKSPEVSEEKIPEAKTPRVLKDQKSQFLGKQSETRVPEAETLKNSGRESPEILGNETHPESIKPEEFVSENLGIKSQELSTKNPNEADISEIPAGLTIKKLKLDTESSEMKVPEVSDEKHSEISEFETPKTPETLIAQTISLPGISEEKTLQIPVEKNPEFFDAQEKMEAGTPKNVEKGSQNEMSKVLEKNVEVIKMQTDSEEVK